MNTVQKKAEKIVLWTPKLIGIVSILFGFSSGSLLAIINAYRMGDDKNKKKYVVNALLYLIVLMFILVRFSATREIALANLFLGYSLYTDMKREIMKNTDGKQVVDERWWLGTLIGAGIFLIVILVYICLSLVW